MPFFPSLPEDAGPPTVFVKHPEMYRPWSEMSQAMMNGESPLSPGEREVILAYAAGLDKCAFVLRGHSEAAYAWGQPRGLLDQLLQDLDTAPVEPKFKALLAFVRKLTLTPSEVVKADVDAAFAAGWDEKAVHDAIAITGRALFMHRLVAGHGFNMLSQETAEAHAKKRVQKGYVNLYPAFSNEAGSAPKA